MKFFHCFVPSIAFLLILAPVALAADAAAPSAPVSILDKLTPDDRAVPQKTQDGVKISIKDKKDDGFLRTTDEFKTPLIITAVAKTDSTDLRLSFGAKGQVILNWDSNGDELRHHDPRTGTQTGIENKGAIPKNTFVTIRWILDETQSRIDVDGVQRASLPGDYTGLSGTVGIGTSGSSTVTVKSLQVQPLESLHIVDAQWGSGDKEKDVTKDLNELIKNGRLDLTVTVNAFGDPAFGSPKELVVTYQLDGKRATLHLAENAKLSLGRTIADTGASATGYPSTQEISDMVDAKKYREALLPISRILDLKGPAAAPYDRHQLQMLRFECLLQIHQRSDALTVLATAAKEAKTPADAHEAAGLHELIQKSPNGNYISKTDKKAPPHDVMDRTKRKEAFIAFWADQYADLQTLDKRANTGNSIPPILEVARALPSDRDIEFMADGNTTKCDDIAKKLKERSVNLLTGGLKEMATRVNNIQNDAETTVRIAVIGMGEADHKKGLSQANANALRDIENQCTAIVSAARDFATAFDDEKTFADIAKTATEVGQHAHQVLTKAY